MFMIMNSEQFYKFESSVRKACEGIVPTDVRKVVCGNMLIELRGVINKHIKYRDLQIVVPEVLFTSLLNYLDLKRTEDSKFVILQYTERLEGNAEHIPQEYSKSYYAVLEVTNMDYLREEDLKFYEENNMVKGYLTE